MVLAEVGWVERLLTVDHEVLHGLVPLDADDALEQPPVGTHAVEHLVGRHREQVADEEGITGLPGVVAVRAGLSLDGDAEHAAPTTDPHEIEAPALLVSQLSNDGI